MRSTLRWTCGQFLPDFPGKPKLFFFIFLSQSEPVRIHHSSHHFATQPSHFVDRTGWQAIMASIQLWIPWRNAHGPHSQFSFSGVFDTISLQRNLPRLSRCLYLSPVQNRWLFPTRFTCRRIEREKGEEYSREWNVTKSKWRRGWYWCDARATSAVKTKLKAVSLGHFEFFP